MIFEKSSKFWISKIKIDVRVWKLQFVFSKKVLKQYCLNTYIFQKLVLENVGVFHFCFINNHKNTQNLPKIVEILDFGAPEMLSPPQSLKRCRLSYSKPPKKSRHIVSLFRRSGMSKTASNLFS